MGVTISFRGGRIPEKTVDHIISQLKEKYKREGYSDETKTDVGGKVSNNRNFWIDKEKLGDRDRSNLERQKVSKEMDDAQYYSDLFVREGNPKHAKEIKKVFKEDLKNDIFLPDNFYAVKSKSICLNPHPKSETFCVRFIKNKNKDEWRIPREFTKTQYVPQVGVHVELCEYLTDVKKKVEKAGSHLKIMDEGDYCDYRSPGGDPKKIRSSVEENRKVIEGIGKKLTKAGW